VASEALETTIAMLRELTLLTGDPVADREMISTGTEMPAGIPHEMVTVADRAAAWITDGAREDAAILYLHGGGYVLGGIGTHGGLGARLSAATGLSVLVLDYRLAPEHTYPAALDDALAGITWLGDRGIDPTKIVVAGDSAGGGLTLATLAALRDRGTTVAAGVALSPWADLTCTNPSFDTRADVDPLVAPGPLRAYAEAYAGGVALDDPGLSPGRGDLSGLPPVLIQVGGNEILFDDSVRTAEAIEAAGGRVALQRWDEAVHVFQMFHTPESDEAIDEIASFVGGLV